MILNLHIGYAKTATTFLQEHVFPNLSNINYGGRFINKQGDVHDNLEWVYPFAEKAELNVPSLLDSIPDSPIKNCLLSHEVIMRPFKTQQALTELQKLQLETDCLRIIVSIRNPVDLIFSRYVHDISTGIFSYYDLEHALDYSGSKECLWPICGNNIKNKLWRKSPFSGGSCICNNAKVKTINIPYYDLQTLDQRLIHLFGDTNVHYIISEQLKTQPRMEVDRLCTFLGIDNEDVGFDFNVFASSKQSNQRSNQDLYKKLKEENLANGVLDKLTSHFDKINKRFAEQTNQPILGELDYY